jgi:hypothetical protein
LQHRQAILALLGKDLVLSYVIDHVAPEISGA